MQKKCLVMEKWLKEKIEGCEQQRKDLLQDERQDEANWKKIEQNIYDVFLKVLSVADKKHGDDESAFKEFLVTRVKEIPENWKRSLDKAKQNGDVDKIHIETIKLNAVNQIEKKIEEIWEL